MTNLRALPSADPATSRNVPAVIDHEDTPRCTAKARTTGLRCKRRPIPGGTVCVIHGGAAPAVRAAAQRRVAMAKAEELARVYGVPQDVGPQEALLTELQRSAGAVAWLNAVVGAMTEDDLVQAIPSGATLPAALVELYLRERNHLRQVARDCHACGVEERRVRIIEEQGRLVSDAIRTIVAGLGRDPADPEVRSLVHGVLSAIADGGE
jgi:hypothetical protein